MNVRGYLIKLKHGDEFKKLKRVDVVHLYLHEDIVKSVVVEMIGKNSRKMKYIKDFERIKLDVWSETDCKPCISSEIRISLMPLTFDIYSYDD